MAGNAATLALLNRAAAAIGTIRPPPGAPADVTPVAATLVSECHVLTDRAGLGRIIAAMRPSDQRLTLSVQFGPADGLAALTSVSVLREGELDKDSPLALIGGDSPFVLLMLQRSGERCSSEERGWLALAGHAGARALAVAHRDREESWRFAAGCAPQPPRPAERQGSGLAAIRCPTALGQSPVLPGAPVLAMGNGTVAVVGVTTGARSGDGLAVHDLRPLVFGVPPAEASATEPEWAAALSYSSLRPNRAAMPLRPIAGVERRDLDAASAAFLDLAALIQVGGIQPPDHISLPPSMVREMSGLFQRMRRDGVEFGAYLQPTPFGFEARDVSRGNYHSVVLGPRTRQSASMAFTFHTHPNDAGFSAQDLMGARPDVVTLVQSAPDNFHLLVFNRSPEAGVLRRPLQKTAISILAARRLIAARARLERASPVERMRANNQVAMEVIAAQAWEGNFLYYAGPAERMRLVISAEALQRPGSGQGAPPARDWNRLTHYERLAAQAALMEDSLASGDRALAERLQLNGEMDEATRTALAAWKARIRARGGYREDSELGRLLAQDGLPDELLFWLLEPASARTPSGGTVDLVFDRYLITAEGGGTAARRRQIGPRVGDADEVELHWPNGAWYRGFAVGSAFFGQGHFRDREGNQIIGHFGPQESRALGRILRADGGRYEGMLTGTGEPWGRGRLHLPNGDVYEGEFQGGRHGRGTYRLRTGQRIEGEFRNGRVHGSATLYSSNNEMQQTGEWREDRFVSGRMIVHRNNVREVHEGEFRNNALVRGTIYGPQGTRAVGQ
ncbi:hypothetical protein OF850_00060 [Roseococcus sp. MDT2-1-1]|uniref:MORN repeat-containing protein n=1 Tax=Sabulicella glaciei TaxID=2984948 RepID=A0ABT3NPC9_9PROT|nr:hypothetical protein [Roseococcus sp. MDT2-1-1]